MSRRDEILDAAAGLLVEEGPDALSMRRLGELLGIRAPSLYKHVSGKEEILAALQERALRAMAVELEAARPDVRGLGDAYRAWALANPQQYTLVTRHPLDRDRLAPGVEAAAAAPLLAAVGGDQARARALWGLAHGLVDLELAGRFPSTADLDATWRAAIELFEPEPTQKESQP
ncbi:TetR/AcrR family transcriptional regulator [Agromyces sp. Marseille-P2726]|uniref:TetR/AcrR family transcriptional regulator n=1 Tax=Agromyces sp. Marseille-P2726 TaxID=2709132 RepID=UPI00156E03B1|nr:TetR/AcrR family transcriptional regulator [Agromyces sp. Marseille-P2726]